MNGEYLADTSVVVDLLRFGESPIVPKGAEILICATVLGELYYGKKPGPLKRGFLATVAASTYASISLACSTL
jgi:predicted nucleic acid-binding protein